LRDVTTKDDLNEMTKDLVKTSDLENIVTGIVKKLFSKFESSLEKKMNEKIIKIQNEMEEKVEALSIENEDLKKRLEVGTAQITSIKKEFSETVQVAKQANMSRLLNKRTIKGLGSCSAGSLCIATTSLSSKVTFRSRLTKLIKS
jgi:cell division septum initiation protein DivIVA